MIETIQFISSSLWKMGNFFVNFSSLLIKAILSTIICDLLFYFDHFYDKCNESNEKSFQAPCWELSSLRGIETHFQILNQICVDLIIYIYLLWTLNLNNINAWLVDNQKIGKRGSYCWFPCKDIMPVTVCWCYVC